MSRPGADESPIRARNTACRHADVIRPVQQTNTVSHRSRVGGFIVAVVRTGNGKLFASRESLSMAQIFHQHQHDLARHDFWLSVIVYALFWAAGQIQRSPYITYAGGCVHDRIPSAISIMSPVCQSKDDLGRHCRRAFLALHSNGAEHDRLHHSLVGVASSAETCV